MLPSPLLGTVCLVIQNPSIRVIGPVAQLENFTNGMVDLMHQHDAPIYYSYLLLIVVLPGDETIMYVHT